MNEDGALTPRKSKFLLLLFSLVPGAGHMYMGRLRKGLELMSLFAGGVYLGYSLGLEIFTFFLPIIWFYSLFDALQLASTRPHVPEESLPSLFGLNNRSVGIGLILVGVAILFERIATPLLGRIDYRLVYMLRTTIVASLFIAGGLRLVLGQKIKEDEPQ